MKDKEIKKDDKELKIDKGSKKSSLKGFMSSQKFVSGAISIVIVIAAIALFCAVNWLSAIILDEKLDLSWDMTSTKKYSFTETSKKYLEKLDKKVTIYCLFERNDRKNKYFQFKDEIEFIDKYKVYDNVKIEFVDPDKNPGIITKIDPKSTLEGLQAGEIVIKSDKRMKRLSLSELQTQSQDQMSGQTLTSFDVEKVITNGINYVAKSKIPKVYFLKGHSEKARESDLAQVNGYISACGYETKDLSLVSDKVDKGDIIFVVGPKKDLNEPETEKLLKFVDEGGTLLAFFNPITGPEQFDNFNKVIAKYNLELENTKIKENSANNYYETQYQIFPEVQFHDLTTSTNSSGAKLLINEARSVRQLKNTIEGLTVTPLLTTSEKAVGEPLDGTSKTLNGPLNVAVAAENTNTKSKGVVFGNADCLTDQYLKFGSTYFIQDLVKWIGVSGDDIYIPAKIAKPEQVNMSRTNIVILYVVTIVVIPLAIFGLGLMIWLKRRRL